MADEKKTLRCSFCGKREDQVHRMIQGPGVRICDECVQLCTVMAVAVVCSVAGLAVSLAGPLRSIPNPDQWSEVFL